MFSGLALFLGGNALLYSSIASSYFTMVAVVGLKPYDLVSAAKSTIFTLVPKFALALKLRLTPKATYFYGDSASVRSIFFTLSSPSASSLSDAFKKSSKVSP